MFDPQEFQSEQKKSKQIKITQQKLNFNKINQNQYYTIKQTKQKMAFSKLDAKKLILYKNSKDHYQIQLNNYDESLMIRSQNNINENNISIKNINQNDDIMSQNNDYSKVFQRYHEQKPKSIKHKIFQKGDVNKIFQKLENDLELKVQGITPNNNNAFKLQKQQEIPNQSNQIITKQNQLNLSKSPLSINNNQKFLYELQLEQLQQQQLQSQQQQQQIEQTQQQPQVNQNRISFESNESNIQLKCNLKNVLKEIEQQNSEFYDLKYQLNQYNLKNNNDNKSPLKQNYNNDSQIVKIIKIADNDNNNNMRRSQFLPQISSLSEIKKKNSSYSPTSSINSNNNNNNHINNIQKNIDNLQEQQKKQHTQERQAYYINKQEPYIIKKYKKNSLDQIDEILNQLYLSILSPKSDSIQIFKSLIHFISKISSIINNQNNIVLEKISNKIENLLFCQKNNQLYNLIQSLLNTSHQLTQSIPYSDLCLLMYNEWIEQKKKHEEQYERIIQENDKLKQEINLIKDEINKQNNIIQEQQQQLKVQQQQSHKIILNETNKITHSNLNSEIETQFYQSQILKNKDNINDNNIQNQSFNEQNNHLNEDLINHSQDSMNEFLQYKTRNHSSNIRKQQQLQQFKIDDEYIQDKVKGIQLQNKFIHTDYIVLTHLDNEFLELDCNLS